MIYAICTAVRDTPIQLYCTVQYGRTEISIRGLLYSRTSTGTRMLECVSIVVVNDLTEMAADAVMGRSQTGSVLYNRESSAGVHLNYKRGLNA